LPVFVEVVVEFVLVHPEAEQQDIVDGDDCVERVRVVGGVREEKGLEVVHKLKREQRKT
jgi:hypothetical protein